VADLLEHCAEGEGSTLDEHRDLRGALRNATEALNRATTPFAGRRMDARLRGALAGQRIDQLAA
jgi:molecular chaperone HscA